MACAGVTLRRQLVARDILRHINSSLDDAQSNTSSITLNKNKRKVKKSNEIIALNDEGNLAKL